MFDEGLATEVFAGEVLPSRYFRPVRPSTLPISKTLSSNKSTQFPYSWTIVASGQDKGNLKSESRVGEEEGGGEEGNGAHPT